MFLKMYKKEANLERIVWDKVEEEDKFRNFEICRVKKLNCLLLNFNFRVKINLGYC